MTPDLSRLMHQGRMNTNQLCRLNRVRGGRSTVPAYTLLYSICVLISTVNAISVNVQNGTFEVGSLDTQIAVKISPKPKTVLKVIWYHCSSPSTCTEFYVIDNVADLATRKGELGDRTSHVVTEDGPEYIMFMVIMHPKDGDQGEYHCQVQVADVGHLLQGNMILTKLEALRNVTGENTTAPIDATVTSLVISMSPCNVTLYWIKCFHSVTPDPAAHFYTYDKNTNKISAEGDLGTRTSHTFSRTDNKKRELLFSLIIQRPSLSDAGPYCCQVDAVGITEPPSVVMWMKVVETRSPLLLITETENATNSILTLNQGERNSNWPLFWCVVGLLSVLIIFLLILLFTGSELGNTCSGLCRQGERSAQLLSPESGA